MHNRFQAAGASARTPWQVAGIALAVCLPLGFLLLFFVWPVVALLWAGLWGEGGFSLTAVSEMFASARTWRVLGNTLLQAICAAVVAVVLGTPAAFVLYRLRLFGRGFLRAVLTVPFVLPTVVVAAAFLALFGEGGALAALHLEGTFWLVVAALVFPNVGVVARQLGTFWARLDETQVQAARVMGARPARAWWSVTFPALLPALAGAFALVFLFCATSFGIVLILGGGPFANIETEIYRLTVQFLDLRSAAVLSLVQFVLVVGVLAFAGRLRKAGERAVDLAAAPRAARALRLRDIPTVVFVLLTVLCLHVAPLTAVVWRSLRGPDGAFSFANYLALLHPPAALRLDAPVSNAVWLSLRTSVFAALLALLLGFCVAFVLSRRPVSGSLRRAQSVFDGVVMLPLGVSAVTLGFGLLLTMHKPFGVGIDLRTSVVLIPLAQALVALPLVVRVLLPVLRGISADLRLAAAGLGAAPLRVFLAVDMPLLGRSLGLALGFAFAASLGEFGATSFLVRPGDETLPVLVGRLTSQQAHGSYGAGFAAAVLLGALTALVLLVCERLRVPGSGKAGVREVEYGF